MQDSVPMFVIWKLYLIPLNTLSPWLSTVPAGQHGRHLAWNAEIHIWLQVWIPAMPRAWLLYGLLPKCSAQTFFTSWNGPHADPRKVPLQNIASHVSFCPPMSQQTWIPCMSHRGLKACNPA